MRERMLSPLGSGMDRSGSSPPSPQLLLAPIRFMAMATVSWASRPIEPIDMAAETNLRVMASTGSTSSSGTGVVSAKSNKPRNSPLVR